MYVFLSISFPDFTVTLMLEVTSPGVRFLSRPVLFCKLKLFLFELWSVCLFLLALKQLLNFFLNFFIDFDHSHSFWIESGAKFSFASVDPG